MDDPSGVEALKIERYRVNVIEFGRALVETGDLDPIYVMLVEARRAGALSEKKLRRWCLAYWMLYHAGASSAMAEAPDFWGAVDAHVQQRGGTRGVERRHFRGGAATEAVFWLRTQFPAPEAVIYSLTDGSKKLHYGQVASRVQKWPMFGPWIAWKIADMLDRVMRIPVNFSDCALYVFKDPLKGGVIVEYKDRRGDEEWNVFDQLTPIERQAALAMSLQYLKNNLGHLKAPPLYDRSLNIQEFETILCKYKSYLGGRYPLGKDIREIRHGLLATDSKLAGSLIQFLPENVA